MALNRFERWTRQVLEVEARKRGIRDPEVRSHAELARMILRHDYASTHSLRSARKLVDSLLDSASASLGLGRQPVDHPHVQRFDARAERTTPPPPPRSEPPPTPSDATIAATSSAVQTDPPLLIADPERLEHSRHEPRALHLRWQVSEQGTARARLLLGAQGELAIRMVSVRADPAYVVHSDVTEHGPVENPGEWVAQLASDDTHCVTSIGLRSAGRFVSIVHKSSRPKTLI